MADLLIPAILSGGAGTRLWPVSRRAYPKPFMRLADGQSLLEKTFRRALSVVANPAREILTITGRDYFFITQNAYEALGKEGAQARFLLEPFGRNTAGAIVLAALDVERRHGRDAMLLILPADHLVDGESEFKQAVAAATELARQDYLVTFGIKPTHAETGYGYIKQGQALAQGHEIERFVEKPNHHDAEAYLKAGCYLWNSGMFCFKVSTLLAAAQRICPHILLAAKNAYAAAHDKPHALEFGAQAFAELPDISIDYAIMEHAEKRAVVPARFGWSDIGSWLAVASQTAPDAQGNRIVGDAVLINAQRTYVQAENRVVAAVGVHDLAIIETADAVLVTHRDSAQEVKKVVEQLKQFQHQSTEQHLTVHRPWGSFTVLEDAEDCKVKRLTIKPGQVLSLQLHHRRSEHWTVVHGTAKVRVGEKEFLLERNESTFIPMGTLHRLENPTAQDLQLIEVQCGDYFGEDDIVRLEDRYGRVPGST